MGAEPKVYDDDDDDDDDDLRFYILLHVKDFLFNFNISHQ